MLQDYLIILLGTALGMFLTILVQSEIINQSEKYEAGFNQAFIFYTTKHRGGIYVGILVVFIFMFLLPNLYTTNVKQLQGIRENLRLWSIGIGIVAQAIGFFAVKKTHSKLKQIGGDNQNSKP